VIGKDELAESARYLDALSDEHELDSVAHMLSLDPEGLMYVAEQRALRAAMLLDGNDPRKLDRTQKTQVTLSEEASSMMPLLTSLMMDGVCIGIHAARKG